MSVRATIADAIAAIASVSDTARLDAELLMAHALGVTRGAMLIDPDRYVVPEGFAALVARRRTHEPVAYIVGYRDFWTIRLNVGPGVLIPRPDSETLIEAAIAHFGSEGPRSILDLGTGPGTLLLAALDQWPEACGVGIDASQVALGYAVRNAVSTKVGGRATFATGGWGDGGKAELVLCNPPYISSNQILMPDVAGHEPHQALFAGDDGLSDYRALVPLLRGHMADGGIAIIEIGHDQREVVTAMLVGEGFDVGCRRDLGGRDRALVCRL